MKLKRETDVLVVGAGPVGLFTALSLAERGLSVQIIAVCARSRSLEVAPSGSLRPAPGRVDRSVPVTR
jgi:2-polyprenyl-6-methoxyphenol hydroxylase-like FAD-dependent oxidoreductase